MTFRTGRNPWMQGYLFAVAQFVRQGGSVAMAKTLLAETCPTPAHARAAGADQADLNTLKPLWSELGRGAPDGG